ncbi:hypothetical protein AVEN_31457-1 [Araneus ventricosus]|uniref:Uncharacterized protein n=1 Tax=Araneus ventricosus TaxID=182803 RepID=A0A4Y2Q925_ARAVE|nr:hypothetical protein AVEN_31457-1 [Araneus ventricosus]
MRAQFEVLIFRVISVKYCLISQNGQVVENWRSASRTEIRTTDLAAIEITVGHKDDNHEVQRPSDWPVQASHLHCNFLSTLNSGGWLFFTFECGSGSEFVSMNKLEGSKENFPSKDLKSSNLVSK